MSNNDTNSNYSVDLNKNTTFSPRVNDIISYNSVSIKHCNDYILENVIQAVRSHFELHNIKQQVSDKKNVVIKPNLLMKRSPEQFTTTHPSLVEAVVIILKEYGVSNITIADSPGGVYTKPALTGIYNATGMQDVADRHGVSTNLDCSSSSRDGEGSVKVNNFTLIAPIINADFIINIAKLKTHAMTTISGAVKNLFGTVPGLAKPEFHFRFPENNDFANMLVDLCLNVAPNFSLIDAVESMEGDGPSAGHRKASNLILAGINPFALDCVACQVINIKNVPMVEASLERGLTLPFEKINLLGDPIIVYDDFKKPNVRGVDFANRLPKWLSPIASAMLSSKPKIIKSGCIGCAKCAEICPAKTISIVDKKAVIHYKECIRCFCCHEMCPVKTITIKRFWAFH